MPFSLVSQSQKFHLQHGKMSAWHDPKSIWKYETYCRSKFYIVGIGIFDHFVHVTLTWTNDFHIQTWPVSPGDISGVQKWTSYVKAFERYRITNVQTDIHTPSKLHTTPHAGGQIWRKHRKIELLCRFSRTVNSKRGAVLGCFEMPLWVRASCHSNRRWISGRPVCRVHNRHASGPVPGRRRRTVRPSVRQYGWQTRPVRRQREFPTRPGRPLFRAGYIWRFRQIVYSSGGAAAGMDTGGVLSS